MHTCITMKTPTPTSVLCLTHHKIASYDFSAFLPAPYDVGGRALTEQTPSRAVSRAVIVITSAALALAIVALAAAVATADPVQTANNAVIVRYSQRLAVGAPRVIHADKTADAAISRLILWEKQRRLLGQRAADRVENSARLLQISRCTNIKVVC
jgi:hypothetical protein